MNRNILNISDIQAAFKAHLAKLTIFWRTKYTGVIQTFADKRKNSPRANLVGMLMANLSQLPHSQHRSNKLIQTDIKSNKDQTTPISLQKPDTCINSQGVVQWAYVLIRYRNETMFYDIATSHSQFRYYCKTYTD